MWILFLLAFYQTIHTIFCVHSRVLFILNPHYYYLQCPQAWVLLKHTMCNQCLPLRSHNSLLCNYVQIAALEAWVRTKVKLINGLFAKGPYFTNGLSRVEVLIWGLTEALCCGLIGEFRSAMVYRFFSSESMSHELIWFKIWVGSEVKCLMLYWNYAGRL